MNPHALPGIEEEERTMSHHHASGTFEVTMKPLSPPKESDGVSLGHMSLEKKFRGDLVGSGEGEMLTAMTAVQGSAGYVAIERVTGTLHGRHGTFVLQHSGTSERGAQHLAITVVPDSGTEELTGLSGSIRLKIVDGQHFYDFEYVIAP
jgi:hypothetical protein